MFQVIICSDEIEPSEIERKQTIKRVIHHEETDKRNWLIVVFCTLYICDIDRSYFQRFYPGKFDFRTAETEA